MVKQFVVDDVHRVELLQRPVLETQQVEFGPHGLKVFEGKQMLVDSGADIEWNIFFDRITDQFLNPDWQIFHGISGDPVVNRHRGFVVDPEGIDKTVAVGADDLVGVGSVGIELDVETPCP